MTPVRESRLRLTALPGPERTVMRAEGELDMASSPELLGAVRQAAAAGPLLLDLGGLEFMDSSGVRALDDLARELPTLRIAGDLPPAVRRVLELTGMMATLPIEEPR
jgi:anti-anti-sigma factor